MNEVTILVRVVVKEARRRFTQKTVQLARVPVVGDTITFGPRDCNEWKVCEVLLDACSGTAIAIIDDRITADGEQDAVDDWATRGFIEGWNGEAGK